MAVTAAGPDTEEDGSPQWRRTLYASVTVMLIMSVAFNFLSPVMPLFLPELGLENQSAVNFWAGMIAAATSFVAAFAAPLWGRLSDTHGRKVMVLRSSFAIGFCTALMGLSGAPWHLLALRALMGAFAGFTSASVVLVTSQVPERRLGFSLGLLSTGQLVGSLLGPILGGLVADISGSYRLPFFAAGAVSMVAFTVCLTMVPERFAKPGPAKAKVSMLQALRTMLGRRGMGSLVLVLMLTQFGVQAIGPMVTLYVQQMVGSRPDLATLGGFAFSVTGLAGIAAVPLLGRLSDRIGERRVILLALAGAALMQLPQAFAGGYWMFVAQRFGLGLFVGGILPAANSLIAKITPPAERGSVYGMTSSAYFVGNSMGPLTGGAVAATLGINWVFMMTAILMLANLAWVWFTVPAPRDVPHY